MDGFEPSDIMAADVDLCIQYMPMDDGEDHHNAHDHGIDHAPDLTVDRI